MSCKIQLENEIHYPGTFIRGRFHCHFNSNKNIRAIKIRITGVEHTYWTETRSTSSNKGSQTQIIVHTATNEFFKNDVIIHTGGAVTAGWYEYDFKIKLPDLLASSYKSTYGYIRYTLAGIVDRPHKFDIRDKRDIVINSLIDLNKMHSYLQEPICEEGDKNICCFCCAGGLVRLRVHLPKRSFVVGETVNVKVFLNNNSNTSPKNIKVELIQVITATVPHSANARRETVTLSRSGILTDKFSKGESEFNIPLKIPDDLHIYNFVGVILWRVEYYIRATCVLSGWHTNLHVDINPTLGHIQAGQMPSHMVLPRNDAFYRNLTQDEGPPPYTTLPQVHKAVMPSEPKERY